MAVVMDGDGEVVAAVEEEVVVAVEEEVVAEVEEEAALCGDGDAAGDQENTSVEGEIITI